MQIENHILAALQSQLDTLDDPRRGQGKRHRQGLVLLIVLLATISGYLGYRAIEEFLAKDQAQLRTLFQPEKGRIPSYSTVRRVLMGVDFQQFTQIYKNCLAHHLPRQPESAGEQLDTLDGIDPDWQPLERLIAVERTRYKGKTVTEETVYYISSLAIEASEFNRGIRGHWHIENSLHWVKDVVFKEDASKIRSGNAPENLSLIKNWAMSIFRKNGHRSMAKAVRLLANDLELIIQYLE